MLLNDTESLGSFCYLLYYSFIESLLPHRIATSLLSFDCTYTRPRRTYKYPRGCPSSWHSCSILNFNKAHVYTFGLLHIAYGYQKPCSGPGRLSSYILASVPRLPIGASFSDLVFWILEWTRCFLRYHFVLVHCWRWIGLDYLDWI